MKCCQINKEGKPCSNEAVATHKNKPLCSKCFLNGVRPEQDLDKKARQEKMDKYAIGYRRY